MREPPRFGLIWSCALGYDPYCALQRVICAVVDPLLAEPIEIRSPAEKAALSAVSEHVDWALVIVQVTAVFTPFFRTV